MVFFSPRSMIAPEMSDSREPRSPRLRTFVLLCLGAVAFAITLVFVRSPTETASSNKTPISGFAIVRHSRDAAQVTMDHQDVKPNPAEQKTGPPDPEALKTATISAERAADAAAALAESAGTPGN